MKRRKRSSAPKQPPRRKQSTKPNQPAPRKPPLWEQVKNSTVDIAFLAIRVLLAHILDHIDRV